MSSLNARSTAAPESATARELRALAPGVDPPDRRRASRGVAGVIILRRAGLHALGWTFFDALFMVVITISGVGFGEVRPMATTVERIHTMIVIALGLVAVAYTVAGFVQFLTEGEIRNYLGRHG